jgi:hypothetical protein
MSPIAARLRWQARRMALLAALLMVAGVFATAAIAFAAFALYLWLATEMQPPLAALAVAGVLAVVAILVKAIGAMTRRSPGLYVDGGAGSLREQAKRQIVSEAVAAGERLGRDLRGYKLLIAAAVVGMVVGRVWR